MSMLLQLLVFSSLISGALLAASNNEELHTFAKLPQPTYKNVNCTTSECVNFDCLNCTFPIDCVYGSPMRVTCFVHGNCTKVPKVAEPNSPHVVIEPICRYCYQTAEWEHTCDMSVVTNKSTSRNKRLVLTKCHVHADVACMGRRTFYKRVNIQFTTGHRWSVAMVLSVTLGGFGADRFYLGLWKSGVGKLFSFGGMGIWTLIDVVLIGTGYVGPADGGFVQRLRMLPKVTAHSKKENQLNVTQQYGNINRLV